jgi:hypothetical protein
MDDVRQNVQRVGVYQKRDGATTRDFARQDKALVAPANAGAEPHRSIFPTWQMASKAAGTNFPSSSHASGKLVASKHATENEPMIEDGIAAIQSPAPISSAALAAKVTAPAMPTDPPIIKTRPASPL